MGHIRKCLATLSFSLARVVLLDNGELDEKPYRFMVCKFGGALKMYFVMRAIPT